MLTRPAKLGEVMISPNSAHAVAVSELRSTMQGPVITPSDDDYERRRKIWNGAIDLRPSIVAACATVSDVQGAVNTARKHGLPVSVLVGGYGWAGQSLRDGGVVIDLSAMNQVVVDPQSQTAIVEGGATAGDVVAAATEFGLTAVVGTMAKIGMAGFTLAGGYGPLTPHFGLGLDNLVAAELVLPDGSYLSVSATENADLFWALRPWVRCAVCSEGVRHHNGVGARRTCGDSCARVESERRSGCRAGAVLERRHPARKGNC